MLTQIILRGHDIPIIILD